MTAEDLVEAFRRGLRIGLEVRDRLGVEAIAAAFKPPCNLPLAGVSADEVRDMELGIENERRREDLDAHATKAAKLTGSMKARGRR